MRLEQVLLYVQHVLLGPIHLASVPLCVPSVQLEPIHPQELLTALLVHLGPMLLAWAALSAQHVLLEVTLWL